MTAAPTDLPHGLVLRLHPSVRVRDRGATLIGGTPLRVIHLKPAARPLLVDGQVAITDAASSRLAGRLLAAGLLQPCIDRLPDPDPTEITCVVPVKDQPEGVERLLTRLGHAFAVLVVDDASEDPDAIATVCRRHGAQLVRLSHNLGPAGARNAGLSRVTTPFVLLVDSDVTIEPRDVLRLGRHFCDPLLAVVGPRVIGSTGQQGRLAAYEAARSALDLGTHGGLVHPRSRIGWLPSACLLARVDALGDGFDAAMRVGEDVDLIWRLLDGGRRVRYEPDAIAHHDHGRTLSQWLTRTAFYGTGGAPLADRHGSKVAPAVLTPVSAAIGVAIVAGRRWSAPVAAGLTALMVAQLARTLRNDPHPLRRATELAALGYTTILGQTMALLLRHWWPAAAMAATRSTRVRRALVLAAVADTVVDYIRTKPRLDPVSFAVLRRLDDLSYGIGLWTGAFRARSVKPLLPHITRRGRS